MTHILCVANKGKIETVGKTVSELENDDKKWIVRAYTDMKSPKGVPLKACNWHSGECGKGENPCDISRCYTDGCPDFGLWVEGYTVFDTCWLLEKEYEAEANKEIKTCDKIIDNIVHRIESIREANEVFDINTKHLKSLQLQLQQVEKEIGNGDSSAILNHPECIMLTQLRDREKALVESRKKALRPIYQRNSENMTFDEFLVKYCSELQQLERAELKLVNWINSNMPTKKAELIAKAESLKKNIELDEEVIKKMFKTPYSLIVLHIRDLNRILTAYSRYKYSRPYAKEMIKRDILEYTGMLYAYGPFKGGRDGKQIVEEFEREQKKAFSVERMIKTADTIHKVKNAGTYIPIVKADGTTTYEASGERYIVGAQMTSNENWRVRR
jgi:hypothetical protein